MPHSTYIPPSRSIQRSLAFSLAISRNKNVSHPATCPLAISRETPSTWPRSPTRVHSDRPRPLARSLPARGSACASRGFGLCSRTRNSFSGQELRGHWQRIAGAANVNGGATNTSSSSPSPSTSVDVMHVGWICAGRASGVVPAVAGTSGRRAATATTTADIHPLRSAIGFCSGGSGGSAAAAAAKDPRRHPSYIISSYHIMRHPWHRCSPSALAPTRPSSSTRSARAAAAESSSS